MGDHVHAALKDFLSVVPVDERTMPRLENLLRQKWQRYRKGFTDIEDEKKWGESKMIWEPLPDNPEMHQLTRFQVEKAITPEQIKQEDKERMALYKHSDKMLQQDLDMLFHNMRKYIEGWWD